MTVPLIPDAINGVNMRVEDHRCESSRRATSTLPRNANVGERDRVIPAERKQVRRTRIAQRLREGGDCLQILLTGIGSDDRVASIGERERLRDVYLEFVARWLHILTCLPDRTRTKARTRVVGRPAIKWHSVNNPVRRRG